MSRPKTAFFFTGDGEPPSYGFTKAIVSRNRIAIGAVRDNTVAAGVSPATMEIKGSGTRFGIRSGFFNTGKLTAAYLEFCGRRGNVQVLHCCTILCNRTKFIRFPKFFLSIDSLKIRAFAPNASPAPPTIDYPCMDNITLCIPDCDCD